MQKTIALAACLALAACAQPKTLYTWGEYQPALLAHAKNPQDVAGFAKRLETSIATAEKAGNVPPGLYAEYGYALLELNRQADAVRFFTKERERWPESGVLMSRLIDRLGRAPAVASPVGGK